MLGSFWNVLNTNSGGVIAVATVILVLVTAWYAYNTRRTLREVGRQADVLQRQAEVMQEQNDLLKAQAELLRQRDARQVRRAIRAVITELKANHLCSTFAQRAPFLTAAYAGWAWACSEAPVADDTITSVAHAYLSIQRYNGLAGTMMLAAMTRLASQASREETKAWDTAGKDLQHAIDVIEADGTLQAFLRSSADS